MVTPECLKYVHENGCHWDEDTCKYAAENGHLECLKYAHENGCRKWNADAAKRSPRVFEIRDENGCMNDILVLCCQKWSPRVFEICARKRMFLE